LKIGHNLSVFWFTSLGSVGNHAKIFKVTCPDIFITILASVL